MRPASAAFVTSVALAALGTALVVAPPLAATAVSACLGLLGLCLVTRWCRPDDRLEAARVARWTAASFGAHLLVGVAVTLATSAWLYLGPDADTYHRHAAALAESWRGDAPAPRLPGGREGFYYVLGAMYWLLGPSAAAGLALNAAWAAALVPVVTDSTRRLLGAPAARAVPALVTLLPAFLLWPAQLLREAGSLFFIALALNCALRLRRTTRVGVVALLALSLALLFTFRGHVALVFGAGLVTGLALGRHHVVAGIGSGMAAVAAVAVVVAGLGVGYAGYRATVGADLRDADLARRDLSASAASGFDPDADVSTAAGSARYLPTGLARLLLGPFPWQVRGARQLPALADAAVTWLLLPLVWTGLRAGRRRAGRAVLVAALPAAAVALTLALVSGNFGKVVRDRAQVLVLLAPFAGLGLAERSGPSVSGRLHGQAVPSE